MRWDGKWECVKLEMEYGMESKIIILWNCVEVPFPCKWNWICRETGNEISKSNWNEFSSYFLC